jgi:hypothetical protein
MGLNKRSYLFFPEQQQELFSSLKRTYSAHTNIQIDMLTNKRFFQTTQRPLFNSDRHRALLLWESRSVSEQVCGLGRPGNSAIDTPSVPGLPTDIARLHAT